MSEQPTVCIMTDRQRKWKNLRAKLSLYNILGQYDGFYTRPPLDHRKLYLNSNELICFNNDGGEVWLGRSDEWCWRCKHRDFQKIVLWYLYQWVFVDWLGLRTKIWFYLLRQKIKRNSP